MISDLYQYKTILIHTDQPPRLPPWHFYTVPEIAYSIPEIKDFFNAKCINVDMPALLQQ